MRCWTTSRSSRAKAGAERCSSGTNSRGPSPISSRRVAAITRPRSSTDCAPEGSPIPSCAWSSQAPLGCATERHPLLMHAVAQKLKFAGDASSEGNESALATLPEEETDPLELSHFLARLRAYLDEAQTAAVMGLLDAIAPHRAGLSVDEASAQLPGVGRERRPVSSRAHSGRYDVLVGPRGMGKSHLLSLIQHRLVGEEEHVSSSVGLLVRLLGALPADSTEEEPAELVASLQETARSDQERAAVALIESCVGDRAIVSLLENLDDVLASIRSQGQQRLRKVLQSHPRWSVVATSSAWSSALARENARLYQTFVRRDLEDRTPSLCRQIAPGPPTARRAAHAAGRRSSPRRTPHHRREAPGDGPRLPAPRALLAGGSRGRLLRSRRGADALPPSAGQPASTGSARPPGGARAELAPAERR